MDQEALARKLVALESRLQEQLTAAWKQSGRAQKQVLADAGITRGAFNNWINNRRKPSLETLLQFVEAADAELVIDVVPKGQTSTEDTLRSMGEPQEALARRMLAVFEHLFARDADLLVALVQGAEARLGLRQAPKEERG